MSPVVWMILGGIVLLFVAWRLLLPALDKLVDQAAARKDIAPVVAAIAKKPEGARHTAYNHAIRRLWDGFNRALAVDLIVELARNHGSRSIAQYWINQVLTVEPGLAKEKFTREFLDSYYKPEVAAKCGQVG